MKLFGILLNTATDGNEDAQKYLKKLVKTVPTFRIFLEITQNDDLKDALTELNHVVAATERIDRVWGKWTLMEKVFCRIYESSTQEEIFYALCRHRPDGSVRRCIQSISRRNLQLLSDFFSKNYLLKEAHFCTTILHHADEVTYRQLVA